MTHYKVNRRYFDSDMCSNSKLVKTYMMPSLVDLKNMKHQDILPTLGGCKNFFQPPENGYNH